MIVTDLKENYIRKHGLALSVDDHMPRLKAKEERIEAALQPKYANKQMWHFVGGNCELLEEELMLQKPPHDDIKDALASCVEVALAPSKTHTIKNRVKEEGFYHKRFGGIF